MLDPEAADEARDKLAGDVRQQIEGAGTLDRADVWGLRTLAYEIKQRNEADYRFYRFQGEPALLESLDHNLKITDGVLRFRIFKVEPDAPANPPPADRAAHGGRGCPSGPRGSAAARASRRPRFRLNGLLLAPLRSTLAFLLCAAVSGFLSQPGREPAVLRLKIDVRNRKE